MSIESTIVKELCEDYNLEESHFSYLGLEDHYERHTAYDLDEYNNDESGELFEPMSPREFDRRADVLSKEKVTSSDVNSLDDVVGFKEKDGCNLKYRKSTHEIVVYRAEPNKVTTVTYYRVKNNSSYLKKRENYYLRDLTQEDDIYNI